MYTDKQFQQIAKLMSQIQTTIDNEIYYLTGYMSTVKELTSNPTLLDKILNLQRIKDICFIYLIDSTQGSIGHTLPEHDSKTIDNFIQNQTYQSVIKFFSKENIIKNYVLENSYNMPDQFTNDTQYQSEYKHFINN